jgi:uncharacterized integral membrane protein
VDQPPTRGDRRLRLLAAVVLIVLTAIFILLNDQEVKVDFLFATVTAPLIFALLLAALLGFVIGLVVPRLRRRPPHGRDN